MKPLTSKEQDMILKAAKGQKVKGIEIKEHPDNDSILSQMLANDFQKARYEKSLVKVCDDLGIEVVK